MERDLNRELLRAAYGGNDIRIRLLLLRGADVNFRDSFSGYTPLIQAASQGRTEAVKVLIKSGADINARNNFGWTAIMLAAENNHSQIVRILLPLSGGLGEIKKQMKNTIRQEKDPAMKLKFRIEFTKVYKKIVLYASRGSELDAKTVKLPPKNRGKFRMQRVRNGS